MGSKCSWAALRGAARRVQSPFLFMALPPIRHPLAHPPFMLPPAGETLCCEKNPIILEKMDFPDPVIKIAIEPKSKADLEKMGMGLNKLAQV